MLPLIQSLLGRIVPRIRALVVVPNRDLAQQVKATFDAYVSGTDLRVGILCGGVNTSSELQYYNDESWMRTLFPFISVTRSEWETGRHSAELRESGYRDNNTRKISGANQKQPGVRHSRPPISRCR